MERRAVADMRTVAYHRYMNNVQILLLFGGESTEHDVSIMSARNVFAAVDRSLFDVLLGYIGRDGKWYLLDKFDDYGTSNQKKMLPLLGEKSFRVGSHIIAPATILPILHGKNGEDGSVQALAQLLHIPIVGCDMTASALGMDKVAAKRIAAEVGIRVVPYRVYRRGDTPLEYSFLSTELGKELFVKPSRAGSSIGVHKVHNNGEFIAALDDALKMDSTVLIEKALDVRELEVAILGIPPHHEVSRVGEVSPGQEFYSYEDKYSQDSGSSVRIPALISDETEQKIRHQAKRLFAEIGGTGLSRVDFFLTSSDEVYFNEINTLPGFTDVSMYPKLWQDSGIDHSALITRLIAQSLL